MRLHRQNGFILLELIICIGLLGMVLVSAYGFYYMGVNSYSRGSHRWDLQQNGRAAIARMDKELIKAEDYLVYSQGNQIHFNLPGDSRLYFFRVRNRDLELLIGPGVTKVASYVKSLDIFQGEDGVIHYRVTVEKEGQEYSLSSAVKPRNVGG
ncbi:PilW family protein [Candidatus Contubernalis alkaliaceticus]|uniref:PilW family protein n=1 Tax=Candidatus Contubernalis alkaliaceticus TaxID=338645 RepID=UPI001F4C0C40|nr:type II secretion system protein [Candidatus Contubernalis alkalaceticus]UNC92566.1 prepilin-type N-terminal cleavage/methylation domain-containing protein [Candidatus Contubernalis alkalaceticus]